MLSIPKSLAEVSPCRMFTLIAKKVPALALLQMYGVFWRCKLYGSLSKIHFIKMSGHQIHCSRYIQGTVQAYHQPSHPDHNKAVIQNLELPPLLPLCTLIGRFAAFNPLTAGLNQGLQSLVEGGVPPRLLIIDDGWQSTDVDASLRQTTSQKLRLAQSMPELDETEGEFIEAELEMLQMSARNIPAGTALGMLLHPILNNNMLPHLFSG